MGDKTNPKILLAAAVLLLGLSGAVMAEPVEIVNPSFELDSDGNEYHGHGLMNVMLAWKKPNIFLGFVGAEASCCDPLRDTSQHDCPISQPTDGNCWAFMHAKNSNYFYQVLDHNIIAGQRYTLTFDIMPENYATDIDVYPTFFYPNDPCLPDVNHIEIARASYTVDYIKLPEEECCPHANSIEADPCDCMGWHYDLTLAHPVPTDANYIGKKLGIKMIADEASQPDFYDFDRFRLERVGGGTAYGPSPSDGQEAVPINVRLKWMPGLWPDKHRVYFSSDVNSVSNRTQDANKDLQDPNYYDVTLQLNTTYYWAIDEVNDGNTWPGELWEFTTTDHLIVDDFDSYADSNALTVVWESGAAGAHVELESGAIDANLIRDGNSLEYTYDNNSFSHSEIEANTTGPNSLPIDSDWSATGAKALVLYFYGNANNDGNTTERMYVALKDGTGHTAVVPYPEDTNNVKLEQWQQWNIKLQQFNDINDVNLADVEKVYIGFGDRSNTQTGTGGTGTVYFEDIRLYPTQCVPELAIASLNDDCIINYEDIKILTNEWLTTGVKADVVDDDNVNFKDYDILADFWLKEILFP